MSIAVWAACSGDAPPAEPDAAPPDVEVATATAVFRPGPPGAGLAWGEAPFPSDVYLDGNGTIVLSTLPSGEGANPDLSALMIESLRMLDRFTPFTNVYFPIDGDIDPATLAGNVKLVDLDAGLAEIPIEVKWRGATVAGSGKPDISSIVVAVRLGVALKANHAYAAYVTRGVRAKDGTPLGRSPAFREAVELATVPSDPARRAAQDTLRPLLERITDPSSLAVATVFHTGNVSRDVVAMRNYVAARPPAISITEVRTDLDFFFGVADAATPPGYSDRAVYEGRTGKRAQPHSHIAAVVHGRIGLPTFSLRSDLTPKLLEYDANGAPRLETTLTVPFTIVLPKATSYANLPAMVYVHGVNRTRVDSLIVADSAAARGIATISFDLMFHGARAVNATDYVNFITGEETPDGFGDPIGLFAPIRFFHLVTNGPVPYDHPTVMRNNLMQSVIDVCSVVSFVENGDVAPLRTALAQQGLPSDLSFHDRTVMQGESFGSFLGGIVVAIEPEIEAAVLNVLPSGFTYPSLLHSGQFSGIFGGLVLDSFVIRDRVILGHPDYDARWDPMVMMWNYALAGGDPANYAAAVVSGELRGGERASILVNEALSDETVPNAATEHYAGAIGLPSLRLSLPAAIDPAVWGNPGHNHVALPTVTGPVAGNLGPGATGAVALWYPASHGVNFWYEDDSTLKAYHPPFVQRAQTLQFTNFTPQVQKLWGDFLASYFATGSARLQDPF